MGSVMSKTNSLCASLVALGLQAVLAESGALVAEHLESGAYTVMASLREEGTQAPIWGGTVVEIPAEGTVEMELPLKRRDL